MPTPTRRRPSTFNTGDVAAVVIGVTAVLGCVAAVLACLAAWITHVVVCIKTASWILLLFGCIVAPIGCIHGFGVWFGMF